MPRWFENNFCTTGKTPLVRLNHIPDSPVTILAKVEGRNPASSVKCRVATAMIAAVERRGILKPGQELIEPASSNMGIALACAAATRKIPLTLVMPYTVSNDRRKLLIAYGAKLRLTPSNRGMHGAITLAEELAARHPDRYVLLHQFKNPANPLIHEQTTGPEIWNDTEGQIDIFVAGIGTGGTMTGVARHIKLARRKNILTVAVEPENSPVLSQFRARQPLVPGPHHIQGIGAGFIPPLLDFSLIDEIQQVTDEEAFHYARRLANEEGILAGISSGAAAAVAARIGKRSENAGKIIVVILPDSGERYLNSILFEGVLDKEESQL